MLESQKTIKLKKQKIVKDLPLLTELIRGTFIKWYQVCARKECKCHKDRRFQHGPYYRVSYSKGKRSYHIYVPLDEKDKIKEMVNNYEKLWKAIEKISALNIKLIRKKSIASISKTGR